MSCFLSAESMSVTAHAFKWFHQRCLCELSSFLLWSIGERRCQGYPAIPAQGTIDDDSISLGQTQWGTLPGHAHITGAALSLEAELYLQRGAHKATSRVELIELWRISVCFPAHNQNSYYEKVQFKQSRTTKDYMLSWQHVCGRGISYFLIYILCSVLFLFGMCGKRTTFY